MEDGGQGTEDGRGKEFTDEDGGWRMQSGG
jgi:hypothetical protein